eukprot:gene13543-biopygen989
MHVRGCGCRRLTHLYGHTLGHTPPMDQSLASIHIPCACASCGYTSLWVVRSVADAAGERGAPSSPRLLRRAQEVQACANAPTNTEHRMRERDILLALALRLVPTAWYWHTGFTRDTIRNVRPLPPPIRPVAGPAAAGPPGARRLPAAAGPRSNARQRRAEGGPRRGPPAGGRGRNTAARRRGERVRPKCGLGGDRGRECRHVAPSPRHFRAGWAGATRCGRPSRRRGRRACG